MNKIESFKRNGRYKEYNQMEILELKKNNN